MKKDNHFLLLFCIVLIFSGCVDTQPKVESVLWDDLNTNPTNLSLVKPNLTGLWVLNKELSENPQNDLKKSMGKTGNFRANKSKSGRGSGEHSGKGKQRKRGNGFSGNKTNNLRRGSLPQGLRILFEASETLELKHEEPLLSIISKDGHEDIYTDFRSTSISSNSDPNQKITIAGWENNVLIIENTINAGRYIQQFKLNSKSGQLWVNTRILTSHLSKPIQFNRVYELVKTGIE